MKFGRCKYINLLCYNIYIYFTYFLLRNFIFTHYLEKLQIFRAGILDISIALDLASYLINERDYVPWATALDHLHAWTKYLSESLPYKLLLSFMRHLLTPAAMHVGWQDEGPHQQK